MSLFLDISELEFKWVSLANLLSPSSHPEPCPTCWITGVHQVELGTMRHQCPTHAQWNFNYTCDGKKKSNIICHEPSLLPFLNYVVWPIRPLFFSNFTIWKRVLMWQISSWNICGRKLGEKAGGLCFFGEWDSVEERVAWEFSDIFMGLWFTWRIS